MFVACIILMAGCFVLRMKFHEGYREDWTLIPQIIAFALIFYTFMVYAVIFPMCYWGVKENIVNYHAFVQTVQMQRHVDNSVEDATLVNNIIVFNTFVADSKWWASNKVWGTMYPKEVMSLQPIE